MPNWDTYFMSICDTIATNVKCPARQIGVVLVKDKHIVSTGYNGPPSGFPNVGTFAFRMLANRNLVPKNTITDWTLVCPRKCLDVPSGEKLGYCPCAHAERNAISTAAKMGHSTDGCTLYMNSCIPCLDCAYSIVNAGIKEVVVKELWDYTKEGFTGSTILNECGVTIRGVE